MVPTSFFLCFGATMHEPIVCRKKKNLRSHDCRPYDSCLASSIHMTHQQPCGAEPGGSKRLLLKSALVEYHVSTPCEGRTCVIQKNILRTLTCIAQYIPANCESAVIITASAKGTAIATTKNSARSGQRLNCGNLRRSNRLSESS